MSKFGKDKVTVLVAEKLKNGVQSEYDKLYEAIDVKSIPYTPLKKSGEEHVRKYNYKLNDKTRKAVQKIYADKVKSLYELIGFEIEEWVDFK